MCVKVFDCEKCLDYPQCQTIKNDNKIGADARDANKIKLELSPAVKK